MMLARLGTRTYALLTVALLAAGCQTGPGETLAIADFSADNLRSFRSVQCGGPAGSCPGGARGELRTDDTPATLNGCPSPDTHGCRFAVVPSPGAWGKALKVVTVAGGDHGAGDALFGGPRNEVLFAKEVDPEKTRYAEGDERYYRWRTNFKDLPPPPDFRDALARGRGVSAYQIILQFHDDGTCHQHVPITMGAIRTNTAQGRQTGNEYQLSLSVDSDYDAVSSEGEPESRLWSSGTPIPKGWVDFVLHVVWSRRACPEPCAWDAPEGGLVELWVDGQHVLSRSLVTLSTWPSVPSGSCVAGSACCEEQRNYPTLGGTEMPVYLKLGLYMDGTMNLASTVYHGDFRIGTTCGAVGAGCPRP